MCSEYNVNCVGFWVFYESDGLTHATDGPDQPEAYLLLMRLGVCEGDLWSIRIALGDLTSDERPSAS